MRDRDCMTILAPDSRRIAPHAFLTPVVRELPKCPAAPKC
jgi:hypothetical protein